MGVSLPYGFTLFSNELKSADATQMFHYLMDLHYSQTFKRIRHIKDSFTTLWIYTILKLLYGGGQHLLVSLPYGFTLFSNNQLIDVAKQSVSLPYGFTLFSNGMTVFRLDLTVSLPYGFTLFSNKTNMTLCTQKFHYLMDLHYSQTTIHIIKARLLFHYLMDLHYSQTVVSLVFVFDPFHYLMDLHYSQTLQPISQYLLGFTTLWIYTILKPQISCAHYTAQGKSTRSSTIVLWRNGIVKGTQISIQHIEFGAHIYAHRCLAL